MTLSSSIINEHTLYLFVSLGIELFQLWGFHLVFSEDYIFVVHKHSFKSSCQQIHKVKRFMVMPKQFLTAPRLDGADLGDFFLTSNDESQMPAGAHLALELISF